MTKKITLILILTLAIFLRLYALGTVPASPDWDEAALGYNAYSILKTGKDEYGKFLPLVFRSFDDYKPPLYIYLTIPSVALFGLNVFAVRLPSAILGTLTIIFTYLLIKHLFEKNIHQEKIALLSAFLLAISPWHLQFSRVAFETNAALFFNVAGAAFFFLGRKKPYFWLFSILLFALAPYTYHSARVFTPLLIIGILIFYRQEFLAKIKWSVFLALLLFILELPLMLILLSPEGRLRIKGVSIFSNQTSVLSRDILKIEDDKKNNLPLFSLLHNRRITYALNMIDGYLRHYDLRWLFLDGDNKRHHAPDMGLLYLWEIPFLLFGIYKLFFSVENKNRKFIFWWFLTAPLPAVITTELPHAVRTLTFLPTFQIFIAVGIVSAAIYLRSQRIYFKLAGIFYILFLIFNITYYFHQYYNHLNYETAKYWQYGYASLVEKAKTEYNNYDKIIVSKKLEEPHMFFLFYLKYDPVKYLAEGGTTSGGFAVDYKKFDKYEFRPIDENKENFNGKTLFMAVPGEITKRYDSILYPDGTEMARIVGK